MKKNYSIMLILFCFMVSTNIQALVLDAPVNKINYINKTNFEIQYTKYSFNLTERGPFPIIETNILGRDVFHNNVSILGIYQESPTKPILSCKGQTNTTIDLSWTPSSDENGVAGYKVYRNGVLKATLSKILIYKVTDLIAGTRYNFTVIAFNTLGNESDMSNTVAITTDSGRSSKTY